MNSNITILYVDDEPINLRIFELNFKRKYQVITAKSGFEGLSQLEAHPDVAIVVSDMKMPGMNGIQFITQAKLQYPNIVFFILTGFDITDEIAKALDDKLINKYFSKPFNAAEMDESIQKVIL